MEKLVISGEYTGKTVEEATREGLKTLGLTEEEAVITVLEEGKKRLFGSVKARVLIEKKKTDGERAVEFLDGLFEILNITATNELVSEGEKIEINVITTNSHAVIGHRGDILDALQNLAGAVANTGREEYKRVVVDCENYRAEREATLKKLAQKLADKAIAKGRKVSLEPMNPYERRIIHAALADHTEVTTTSEGREPNRYIVIIPNNYDPSKDRFDRRNGNRGGYDKKRGGSGRRPYGEKRQGGRNYEDRKFDGEKKSRDGEYREDRREGDYKKRPYNRDRRNGGNKSFDQKPVRRPAPFFGTYLGNSGAKTSSVSETSEKAPKTNQDETV